MMSCDDWAEKLVLGRIADDCVAPDCWKLILVFRKMMKSNDLTMNVASKRHLNGALLMARPGHEQRK